MSYSDSNSTKRFKGVARAFKDLKLYTATQGQQACNAIKGRELISSIKQSTDKFPGFKRRNRVCLGNMKHESLCDDDEAVLWSDYEEDSSSDMTKNPQHQHFKSPSSKNPFHNSLDSLNGTEFSFISPRERKNFGSNSFGLVDKGTKSLYHSSSGFGRGGVFSIPFLRKVK
ncbi:hypothetical protein Fcan01_18657 [Folsomia candida]|uniref:Uncharacterized protein n=1 Tax=Folsomia candida TaxID=158441 RepID=A0A226DLM7_FOLCA|nr:hypothetical protein Fcan01_18657 [Folsomia candida]